MNFKPVVYVLKTDYSSIASAVEAIFLRFPFVLENKLVWVKPNMLGNFSSDRHVTTHPSLVRAVVNKLISLNARIVVADNPGSQSIISEDKTARDSGILAASQGKFALISNDVETVALGDGLQEKISISKIAKECDIMISLPKMKTHLQTIISGAIKNSYGMVVGIHKPYLHLRFRNYNDFSRVVAQIYNIRKPDLIIMDAVVAMEGDGPNSPRLRNVNRVIAGTDGVAVDYYVTKIMGMDPERIPLLRYCVEKNIGSSQYVLEGDETVIDKFLAPRTYSQRRPRRNSLIEDLFYQYTTSKRIRIDTRRCKKCLNCIKICPAGAMSLQKYPRVAYSKCILCFCCQEMCPHNAITFNLSYKLAKEALKWFDFYRSKIVKARK